jgi:hypothetical protein
MVEVFLVLYATNYLLRSVAISPAAFIGGLLWNVTPSLPFVLAGAIGMVGRAVFALPLKGAR